MLTTRYNTHNLIFNGRCFMARGRKKGRTLKERVSIKTGSKKDFIKQGEKGKIPSHNRLDKHRRSKQKSAYQRFLEETGNKDESSGLNTVKKRLETAEEMAKPAEVTNKEKRSKESKDFNRLSGDELLDMFN